MQPALHDDGRQQRDGVERRADAAEDQQDGEDLSAQRQRMDFAESDRRRPSSRSCRTRPTRSTLR